MSLEFAQTSASLSWQQSKANTPFVKTSQGPDAVANNFVWTTGVGGANEVLTYYLTLAASTHQDIDLQTGTNLLGESVNLVRVYGIQVLPEDGDCVVSPGNPHGLVWFFGASSNSVTVPLGGIFNFSNPVATTVDVTHHTFRFENPSSTAPVSVKIAIIGGT